MARVKSVNSPNAGRKIRPALSPDARENQLISLSMDLVEQRLLDGTASAQETVHFLRLGSSKAVLEKERLEKENELLRAKTQDLQSRAESKEIYEQALKAFRNYSGQGDPDEY